MEKRVTDDAFAFIAIHKTVLLMLRDLLGVDPAAMAACLDDLAKRQKGVAESDDEFDFHYCAFLTEVLAESLRSQPNTPLVPELRLPPPRRKIRPPSES